MVSNWPRRAEDLAGAMYIVLPPLPEGLEYNLVQETVTGHFGVMIVRSKDGKESTEDERS